MASTKPHFEFRAKLSDLERGLDTLHGSVDQLRRALGRDAGDRALMHFETALAEIGNNALLHGEVSPERPVGYLLQSDSRTVVAWLSDWGPAINGHWARTMPPATSEAGRGLPLARSLLDSLEYERKGQTNRWRLVKHL